MENSIIKKYLNGTASQKERIDFLHWIEADEQNKKEYERLRKIYDLSLFADNTDNLCKPIRKHKQMIGYAMLARVAIMLLCIGLSVFATLYFTDHNHTSVKLQSIYVPKGQTLKLNLDDGTDVWLNGNTTLKIPASTDNARNIFLEGEAFFCVNKDNAHPFIVHTQHYSIKVLGTTFNVKAFNPEQFETALLTGKVEIKDSVNRETVALLPHEKVSVHNGKLVKQQITEPEFYDWNQDIYIFENEPYSKVFKTLERYYNVPIIIKNQEILDYKCTGKFKRTDHIEHTLNILNENHPFHYKWDENGEKIVIY